MTDSGLSLYVRIGDIIRPLRNIMTKYKNTLVFHSKHQGIPCEIAAHFTWNMQAFLSPHMLSAACPIASVCAFAEPAKGLRLALA